MAVASPVLEREVDTVESGNSREFYRGTLMTAEERHNAQISSNYKRLINPEITLKDLKESANVAVINPVPAQAAEAESLYLVENARADSEIFRADSAVNKAVEVASSEDEENEDLRPTQTTIQYKTTGVKKTEEEGKIKTSARARTSLLTKKDKIIVAVALSVIIALFVLIIVNSSIISGLNSNVNALQENLSTAESLYEETLSAKNAYLEESNLFQVVSEFAVNNGMTLR